MDLKNLLQKSVKIYVQNPDEFLSKLVPEQFNNKSIIGNIKTALKTATRIGAKSAVGEVYKYFPKGNNEGEVIIIKSAKYCPKNTKMVPVVEQLCEIAEEGDIIYQIPNTYTGKTLVYAPNYLVENLIGMLLSSQTEKYTSSFMKIYGFQYDYKDSEKVTYTASEPLVNVNEYIRSDADFLHFTFQIVHALNVAQKIGNYVHYDLHQDNVMARKIEPQITVTPLSNGEFLYSYFDFQPVIIDYGFNRYETKDSILVSRAKIISKNNAQDILDNYFYNPYYDLFTFLFTADVKKKNKTKTFDNWNIKDENLTSDIFDIFVNIPSSEDDPDSFFKEWLEYVKPEKFSWWRPYPERLATQYDNYKWHSVCKPEEFLLRIVQKIKKMSPPFPGTPKNDHEKDIVLEFIKKNKFWVSTHLVELRGVKTDVQSKLTKTTSPYYQYRTIDESTKTYSSNIVCNDKNIVEINSLNKLPGSIRSNITGYHRQLSKKLQQEDSFSYSLPQPWIHLALIDQVAGRDCGYNFRFDCCRVDIRNYFQTETINSGIAINASFFNITTNFAPVGYFKTDNYESKTEIPKNYKKYFGIVGLDKEGMLRVDKPKYADEYQRVVTSGPILVWDFEKQITEDMLSTELNSDNNFLWQCRKSATTDPGGGNATTLRVFKDGLNNCDQIQPGEISHASNPNPRSAIFVTREGKVGMLYVEGRDQKGPGLDLSQLADLCKYYGARFAINLDGGRSSQMLWKKQGQEIIYQTNSYNTNSYPVGSIISYIKQQ
jgi:hypothetical protein